MTPNPTELASQLPEELVERHRHLDCKHYDSCLATAATAHRSERTEWQSVYWASWTCTRCPVWMARDAEGQDPADFAQRMRRGIGQYPCSLDNRQGTARKAAL